MQHIVLIIDCGTQSIRAMLINQKGEILLKKKKEYLYIKNEKENFIEFDANDFFEDIIKLLIDLRKSNKNLFEQIKGVSITTQRDTFVVVDRNGKPLRNAISWMDRRKAKNYKPLNPFYSILFKIVGMDKMVKSFMEDARFNWIIENEPQIWEKTHKYLLLPQYLNYKFIGKYIESDAGTVGHIPFDYKNRTYDKPYGIKRKLFNVEQRKLANIAPSTTVMGTISDEICERIGLRKGTPLIASGSDKACETVGVGCIKEGIGSISLGSQVTIQATTDKYYELTKFVPPFDSVIPNMYNPEIILYRGFWLITWFIKEFGYKEETISQKNNEDIFHIMDSKLKEIPIGCDGLILQPYWGQDILRPLAKGSILGFNDQHTRMHIYRAIIEGIGYSLKEGINKIEEASKVKIKKIALSGGGSKSDIICQILSDILNKELYTIQTYEASGIGAAMTSFIGLNIYENFEEACTNMVRINKVYIPKEENAEKYNRIYNNVYKKIYKNVKNIYTKINKTNI
ncbi:FGGY-family carbohydrate kinase [Anaerofustis sp.]|uniref:FGGY-family carbohydrate kinase n=1 Tax=Anaerofustis sp. TaxID=1872517 RepID=UPI0025C43683|nr:FGGY-family carbohydrate kinase [Anaerofustis sp.]